MKKIITAITISLLIFSCGSGSDNTNNGDGFNRSALLTNITDNIIIPAYANFYNHILELENATTLFISNTDQLHLNILKQKWFNAYKSWQHIEMFDINKAEEIFYRRKMNAYPCDANRIELNILNNNYDFNDPNHFAAQGFPALDYMLNGLSDEISIYTGSNGSMYLNYLQDLISEIKTNTIDIKDEWNTNRDNFISSTGNTATSSLNKLTNDFIFYYEKGLRANKIGIPAGVFSGTPLPDKVECYYYNLETGNASKTLMLEAFNAVKTTFNGQAFETLSDGVGLANYLQYLNALSNGVNLDIDINNVFEESITALSNLDDDFMSQIINNNYDMLVTYDKIQQGVVLLKTDMLGYLNIDVDYVDADGD
jgi:hypothetical protein